MFGHHPLLERQLRKSGRRASATVLDAHRTMYTETTGNSSLVGNTKVLWKLALRVEPDGEAPFEAGVDALLSQMWSPAAGAQFAVLYDPADHSKVVLDNSDEGNLRLEQELDRERTDARVARMRASGQDDLADRYQRIHDPALGLFDSSSLSRNPDERRKQLAERRAKIKEIMGGAQTVVIGGQFQQPAAAPAAAPAPDPGAVADALTKLAGLRDRGLLTDDEFQSQKRKLLGE